MLVAISPAAIGAWQIGAAISVSPAARPLTILIFGAVAALTSRRFRGAWRTENRTVTRVTRAGAIRCAVIAGVMTAQYPIAISAQSGALLTGVVTGPDRVGLAHATVTLAGATLVEGARVTHTNSRGRYLIGGLRPGHYTVTFAEPGFRTIRREIDVHTAAMSDVSAELAAGDPQDIVVIDQPIDPSAFDATRQRVFDGAALDDIPTARLFASFGALISGMVITGTGQTNDQDASGSAGNTHARLAIDGSRASDLAVQLDGFSAAVWQQSGSVSPLALPDSGTGDTAFVYSGADPAVATGGVVVTFTPRTGGEAFHGELIGTATGGVLQSSNLAGSGLSAASRVKDIEDVNPAGGGPMIRHRAWFWTSARVRRRALWLPSSYDLTPRDWVYIPSSRQAVDDERNWTGSGRVAVRAPENAAIDLNYLHDDDCDCHWLMTRTTTPEAAEHAAFVTDIVQARWRGAIADRVTAEVGGSGLLTRLAAVPEADAVAPAATDIALANLNLRSRSAFGDDGYRTSLDLNLDVRGSISFAAASHVFTVGANVAHGRNRSEYQSLAPYVAVLQNGLPLQVTYVGERSLAVDTIAQAATYLRDRWSTDGFAIDAGVRVDRLTTGYPAVTEPRTSLLPERPFPPGSVLRWLDVSPRFGVAHDLTGAGRTVLHATISRYPLQEGLDLTRLADPAANARLAGDTRRWKDTNHDYVPDGNPANPDANGELGDSGNKMFGVTPPPLRLDPAAASGFNVRPAQWEATMGVRRMFEPLTAAFDVVRRVYTNFTVIDNIALRPSDYDGPYCVTEPQDPRLPGGGGNPVCGLFDLKPSKRDVAADNVVAPAARYGRQYERWTGMHANVAWRVATRLTIEGGVSAGKRTADDCDVAPKLDNPSTLYCHTETPILADVKVMGVYGLPWRSRLAATMQSSPGLGDGTGVNAIFLYHDLPGLGRSPSAANGTAAVNLIAPGSRYGQRVNKVNVRLARTVDIGGAHVDVRVDAYNLFNSATPLMWNNVYGAAGPNLTWLAPQSIIQGRLVVFGMKLSL